MFMGQNKKIDHYSTHRCKINRFYHTICPKSTNKTKHLFKAKQYAEKRNDAINSNKKIELHDMLDTYKNIV